MTPLLAQNGVRSRHSAQTGGHRARVCQARAGRRRSATPSSSSSPTNRLASSRIPHLRASRCENRRARSQLAFNCYGNHASATWRQAGTSAISPARPKRSCRDRRRVTATTSRCGSARRTASTDVILDVGGGTPRKSPTLPDSRARHQWPAGRARSRRRQAKPACSKQTKPSAPRWRARAPARRTRA